MKLKKKTKYIFNLNKILVRSRGHQKIQWKKCHMS